MGGWQFRKSKKIFPGVRLNVSKKGIGFSVGGPGGRVTLSPGRKRITLSQSIPGTGLRRQQSYSVDKLKSQSSDDLNSNANIPVYLSEDYQLNKTKFYKYGFRTLLTLFASFCIGAVTLDGESKLAGTFLAYVFLGILLLSPALWISRKRNLRKSAESQFLRGLE